MNDSCKFKRGPGVVLVVLLVIIAAWLAVNPACAQKKSRQFVCKIEGKVLENPECRYVILTPADANLTVFKGDSIPLDSEGRFSYSFKCSVNDPYRLVADNELSGHYITEFIAENTTVHITMRGVHSDNRPEIVSDGPIQKEIQRVQDECKARFYGKLEKEHKEFESSERNRYTPQVNELRTKYEQAQNEEERASIRQIVDSLQKADLYYTEEYKDFMKRNKEVRKLVYGFRLDYSAQNITVAGLYWLKEMAYASKHSGEEYVKRVLEIYNTHYANKFTNNALSRYMCDWVVSQQIKPGGRFLDFTAPDLNGKQHRLSREIAGKVALIDFWASWCGPCRRNSMSMIPIYEKYKDKGFTVVGIARESNSQNMQKALKEDGYPWLNLLEIKDRTNLWLRYGINAAGRVFLVGSDGKIIAVNPTAEEVRATLEKLLK